MKYIFAWMLGVPGFLIVLWFLLQSWPLNPWPCKKRLWLRKRSAKLVPENEGVLTAAARTVGHAAGEAVKALGLQAEERAAPAPAVKRKAPKVPSARRPSARSRRIARAGELKNAAAALGKNAAFDDVRTGRIIGKAPAVWSEKDIEYIEWIGNHEGSCGRGITCEANSSATGKRWNPGDSRRGEITRAAWPSFLRIDISTKTAGFGRLTMYSPLRSERSRCKRDRRRTCSVRRVAGSTSVA